MDQLAINGGTPVRSAPYPDWPQFDESEEQALLRALHTRQWWRGSGGKEVESFEREFAESQGAPYALAVSTGTTAIELALMIHGIGPGDKVLVPAFTFVATAMAVQKLGAEPVLYDIDLDTYNTDEVSFENVETEGVKAIIPVFMAGLTSGLDAVRAFAEKHGIIVIYDAAHGHGAMHRNQRIGEMSGIGCFSFQNFKLMTAGEGGIVTLDDEDQYKLGYLYHSCGRPGGDKLYRHEVVGSNLRMNEFSAAVLRCQLARLGDQTAKRMRNGAALDEAFKSVEGIIPQTFRDDATVFTRYMVMLRIDPAVYPTVDRQEVVNALIAEGLPAFVNYRPLYRLRSMWDHEPTQAEMDAEAERFPNTEKVGMEGIWIHHRVLLGNEDDAVDVARAVDKVLKGLAQ